MEGYTIYNVNKDNFKHVVKLFKEKDIKANSAVSPIWANNNLMLGLLQGKSVELYINDRDIYTGFNFRGTERFINADELTNEVENV